MRTYWNSLSDMTPDEREFWRKAFPNFTPEEFVCKVTGRLGIDMQFMASLQSLRTHLGFAMPITSGYRDPSRGATTAHAEGAAADVNVFGERAYRVIKAAPHFGFTGIGIGQRIGLPNNSRFIHLDNVEHKPERPRPLIWSYAQ